jgi:hypothetical protein
MAIHYIPAITGWSSMEKEELDLLDIACQYFNINELSDIETIRTFQKLVIHRRSLKMYPQFLKFS